ncbi:MAG: LysM peptidoglycan-binding domain-containing protein [Betaproteobacteria bacterium]|nr:LysM peptidoglycan-binding domain-containing protein [Betaproteobacteria bacterium]
MKIGWYHLLCATALALSALPGRAADDVRMPGHDDEIRKAAQALMSGQAAGTGRRGAAPPDPADAKRDDIRQAAQALLAGEAPRPDHDSPPGGTLRVAPGDSLSAIAQRVYGDPSRYRLIYEANRARLSSPDRVSAGMVLVLPRVEAPGR